MQERRIRISARYLWIPLLALVVIVAACAAGSAGPAPAATADSAAPVPDRLPEVPGPDTLRDLTALNTTSQQGAQADHHSAGAVVSGTSLMVNAAADGLEYGLYSYNTGDEALAEVAVDLSAVTGPVWVGIADFGPRSWEFTGPYTAPGLVQLTDLSQGIYTSLDGDCHVLVLAWHGSTATVAGVEFTTDDTPASFSVSGNISGDPGDAPLAGVTLTLSPGGATAVTDAAGDYVIPAVTAGEYTITPALEGYTFSPVSYNLNLQGLASDVDFYGIAD